MLKKTLRKMTALAMALAMVLSLSAWAKAAPSSDPGAHSTAAIQARGVLTVSLSESAKYSYRIPDDPVKYGELAGTWDGIAVELCRRFARGLGVEVKFVGYDTVAAQLQAVASGEADLAAANFAINEERLALYEMTDNYSIATLMGDTVFLSTDPKSGNRVQSEADLARARIAVIKGTVQVTNTAAQYPQAELVELADNRAVLDALAAGDVDAGVFSAMDNAIIDQITEAIRRGTVVSSSYQVAIQDDRGIGLILMKGNTELCQYLNRVIDHLKRSCWMHECFKTEELEAMERGIINRSDMVFQNIAMQPENCPSLDFDDLDTSLWYHEYVDYVIDKGLMGGTGSYRFSPLGTLTRAEAVTVLWRIEGEPRVNYELDYTDVEEGLWYTGGIRWAVCEEIMGGYGNGIFGTSDPITREQLAAILYRYAVYKGYNVTTKGDLSAFRDASETSDWAYEAMEWACGVGIYEGSGGAINPQGNTTRCEFSATIMRFMRDVARR